MSKKHLCVLTIFCVINAVLSAFLFPRVVTQTTREIAEEITNNPVVSLTTHVYANTVASVVNSVSWIPQTVSRVLEPFVFSTPETTDNDDKIEKFLVEFDHGLGNEDAYLKIDELIRKYGYSIEIHEVETQDGYLLSLFRIPGNGTGVFLMHGLLGSADDFVVAGQDSGLAYLLADAGYDVWMGNARGNKHSRRHGYLKPSRPEFWDFSYHEIGVYDLPAMIDYVLNITEQASLKYIGHSQGTTAFFVMASERPEYNDKVSLMIALSPVAFMGHVRSPVVRLMAPETERLHKFSKNFGLYEFLPDNNLIRSLKILVCGRGTLAEILCGNTLFLMSGYDLQQMNVSNLPVVFGHLPSGASIKQFAHYGQGVNSQDFRKFDFGAEENVERYGVRVPPSYALENILTPICLFYSQSDWLAHTKDVNKLYKRLSNVVDFYKIPFKQFNHVDFFLARDVRNLVYYRVLNDLLTL